jgi:tripartite-type tricarboxylate transporter receptor subunit TctC
MRCASRIFNRNLARRLDIAAAAILAALLIAAAVSAPSVWAQAARTIRIVVSVPAGGAIDSLARILADEIARASGQTIIIDSRPGGGGVIAAEAVARAAPDGNTLLINTNGMIVNALLRKVSFDPLTSFEPICTSPLVLVVNSASPYRTLAELVAGARAKPGELSFASVGPHSTQHMAIERFKRQAGIDITYVPYPGGAPAINALMGQHVTAVLQNYQEVKGQLDAGALRAVAVPSARRIEPLPELPTISESGFPGFDAEVWFGLVAPAKTPPAMVAQLVGAFSRAVEAPEVKPKLAVQALYPDPRCGSEFAAHLRRQSDDYAQMVRALNIKGE